MTSEHEGFLERWSRRKQQPEDEPEALPEVSEPAEEQHEPEEPALTDEDMPDIETLAPDSDVSPFFSPGVSERLRQKALRKIFHSARYNVKDGLDDYDEDFTLLQPLGDTDTWDWRRQRERIRKRLEEKEEALEEADELDNSDDLDAPDDADQSEDEPEEK